MSPPEVRLWAILRSQPDGFRFRRQHPIGPFILDFYCARARLAIEIDGIVHDMGDQPRRDEARTLWLGEQGICVMRLRATDVMADLDGAVSAILQRVAFPLHHPADGPHPHLRWRG